MLTRFGQVLGMGQIENQRQKRKGPAQDIESALLGTTLSKAMTYSSSVGLQPHLPVPAPTLLQPLLPVARPILAVA